MTKNKLPILLLTIVSFFFVFILILLTPQKRSTAIPTPTPTPSPAPIEIKTYKNPVDNYQIDYPSDWVLTASNDNTFVSIRKEEVGEIDINSTNPRKITVPIENWIKQENKKIENTYSRPSFSQTYLLLNNDDVLKIDVTPTVISADFFDQIGNEYLFSFNKKIFSITGVYYSGEVNEQLENQINKILSTFKFTQKKYASLGEACLGAVSPEYSIDCQPGLTCKFSENQTPGDKGICVKLDN